MLMMSISIWLSVGASPARLYLSAMAAAWALRGPVVVALDRALWRGVVAAAGTVCGHISKKNC